MLISFACAQDSEHANKVKKLQWQLNAVSSVCVCVCVRVCVCACVRVCVHV